jgi:hypothetical protein
MKFPVRKIILPDRSFSKLLLYDFTPIVKSCNRYKNNDCWLSTKEFSGYIGNGITYDIITYAKYDYNRNKPNDICNIKTNIYSKDYNYSVHERCKIELYGIDGHIEDNYINMSYDIFENNKFNGPKNRKGDYTIPLDLYKKLDMSYYFNDAMKNKYDYLKKIILKEK